MSQTPGECLSQVDQVRMNVRLMLVGQICAGSSETCLNFVADEKDIMCLTEVLDFLQVALGWNSGAFRSRLSSWQDTWLYRLTLQDPAQARS